MPEGGIGLGLGRRRRGRAAAMAVAVIVALLVQSLGLGAIRGAAEAGAGPAVTSDEAAPPEPTAEPEPVVVVEPTSTPEPSPTVAPADPSPPAPEASEPVVDPTTPAAPGEDPAPAEELPTPTAAATATAGPEPTATPAPAPDTLDCAPVDTAAAQPGQLVEFGCVLVAGSAWSGARLVVSAISSTDPDPREWTVAVAAGDGSWSQEGSEAAVVADGELAPAASLGFALRVRVPAQASEGDAATVDVSVADPGRADAAPVVARFAVTSLAPPPDGLTCATAETVEVPAGETVDLACSLTVNSARVGTRLATAVTASGEPWAVELAPAPADETAPDTDTPAIATLDETTAVSAGDTVDLTLRLTAPTDAASGEAVQIAVATGRMTTAVPDPTLDDAELTLDAAVEEPEFGAASVESETGGLDCGEPNGDRVTPNGQVVYQCRFAAISGLNLSTEFVATMDTAGWDVSISDSVLGTSGLDGDGTARIQSDLVANLLANLTVTVKAPSDADPGDFADVDITVRTCTVLWALGACVGVAAIAGTASIQTTVGATAPVTGTFSALGIDIASLACYPASAGGAFDITQGGQLQITCSLYTLLSASLISSGAQLGFSAITSTFPANWGVSYVINGQSYTALSGVALDLGSLNLLTLSTNGVFSFSVLFDAPCNAALEPASIGLSTALDVNLLDLGVSTGLGPSVTLPPNAQSGSFGAVTAMFVGSGTRASFGTAQITGLSGATQDGLAQLSVSRPACAGAMVSVGVTGSGGNFNAPAGDGKPLPLANLSLTSAGSSPSDSGLTVALPPVGGTAVTTNPTVATVSSITGTATYMLTLDASLVVPAGTQTGTHTATLQVTVTGTTP